MEPGKLASQIAHACSQSLLAFIAQRPDMLPVFLGLGKSGTRITLQAKTLDQLLRARDMAAAAGLPHALFEDSGHVIPGTAFDGSPIVTALAIGPAPREVLRAITKRFPLI